MEETEALTRFEDLGFMNKILYILNVV